jgi:flagellin-like hook-associated protein FlgL
MMDEMVKALQELRETLIYGKNNDALSKAAQEILNANIVELSDVMVRYCKENYGY